jgi:ABC-type multidrug transport system ATPase subunit
VSSAAAIATADLSNRCGATLALDHLDLVVQEGEVYGYLGPNGSGKTTTIRLLLGLRRPTTRGAELFGGLLGAPAWALALSPFHHVGLVPAQPFQAGAAAVMVALGLAVTAVALGLTRRRDLAGAWTGRRCSRSH